MATAYATLVSLMNDLDLISNHPRHSFSFDNSQIQSLSQTVHFFIEFMGSYVSLECRIASAALEAHDVVESHVVDQIHAGSTLGKKQRSYFLLDLQKAIDNMNYVKRKVMQFKAKTETKAEQPTSHSLSTSSAARSSKKNKMVGFDAPLARLLDMLTGEPPSRLVIPVEGMGGIGKTTLTKSAYEHKSAEYRFDVRCWATISQEYTAHTILTQLLFGKESCTGQDVNLLGDELHKKLWGRRYLIILDDMWSMEAWDEIQMYLPDNNNGSRIIVTTRLCNLATNLNSSPFKMEFLDKDQSWKLFCGEAFDEGKCPVELEVIGRKIVRRCQGLPLSIIVIGGHLRKSTRALEYWEKVFSFINPISSSEKGENCMEIIGLSYHHLPIFLKPCFLCMGIFKEDEEIHVTNLIRFWVAEGLIKAKEELSLEEEAEDCLNNLIDRNLVIVRGRRWNGKPEYCGIHDIVREFCLKVGRKEKFLGVINTKEGESGKWRIVIRDEKHNSDNKLLEVRSLRVLECEEKRIREDDVSLLVVNFQQVNLRYLKYTDSSFMTMIYNFPSSISLLWNLQTITILYNLEISMPQEIWEMTQLRHLLVLGLRLPYPLQECIVLRNLQTLETARNLVLTEKLCKKMPNIKKLSLVCYSEFKLHWCHKNLCLFNKLESLDLSSYGPGLVTFQILLPSSLQELDLGVDDLDWKDVGSMIKSFPCLGRLRLRRVRGQEWSLVDEEFPCLKYLEISYCRELIYWNANNSHFPALQELCCYEVDGLNEIPFEIGDIPSLERITLWECSESAAVSAMRILVEQETLGNQDLHLEVSFYEMEKTDRFQTTLLQQNLQSERLHVLL